MIASGSIPPIRSSRFCRYAAKRFASPAFAVAAIKPSAWLVAKLKQFTAAGTAGYTDLLITWLFKITTGAESQYYLASVVGILVFVVVALISLVVYNVLPSIKNEEDFQ